MVLPAALLAEALLLAADHHHRRLGVRLADLVPPVVLPAHAQIRPAPVHQARRRLATAAGRRSPRPLRRPGRSSRRFRRRHGISANIPLARRRGAELAQSAELQIDRAVAGGAVDHRADAEPGVAARRLGSVPRRHLEVRIHDIHQTLPFSAASYLFLVASPRLQNSLSLPLSMPLLTKRPPLPPPPSTKFEKIKISPRKQRKSSSRSLLFELHRTKQRKRKKKSRGEQVESPRSKREEAPAAGT